MKFQTLKEFFAKIYSDYKILFLSYAAILALCIIFLPSQTLEMLEYLQPRALWAIIKLEKAIYLPLILAGVFLLVNIALGKKFETKQFLTNVGVILFFTFLTGFFLRILYWHTDLSRVVFWSNAFMEADKAIFGVYPAFWFYEHHSVIFEQAISFVYTNITTIIALWILFLFVYEKGVHIKDFIKRYFLAFIICFPLWMIFPAICPAQMYIGNILNQPPHPGVAEVLSKPPPSEFLDHQLRRLIQVWTDRAGNFTAISTFPSMHTIWGILLAYSVGTIFLRKKYGWIAVSISVFIALANLLGAFYLLQHYVVDVLAGILLAVPIAKLKFKTQ